MPSPAEDIKVKFQLIDEYEDVLELWPDFQAQHDNADKIPGEDHTYWVLQHEGENIGLTSAVYRPEKGYVFLSYAIIIPSCKIKGLQRKMIQHRLRWAKKQGAYYAVTYTLLKNYPSMVNLLRCGFRLAHEPRGWGSLGQDVHYFEKQLT